MLHGHRSCYGIVFMVSINRLNLVRNVRILSGCIITHSHSYMGEDPYFSHQCKYDHALGVNLLIYIATK